MFARPEFLLFALGILVAVVGAAVLDLWLLAASCRSLFRRDPIWGVFGVLLGLLILGGIALYSGLLYQLLLTLVAA
jgi:H+/Cl- antiporter ClcA